MTEKELLNLIVERDYEAVEVALKNGFDVNKSLNNDTTGIEWASYTEDIQMMEIFWKYGAKSENEYVQDFIKEFEKGKTYLDFQEVEENKEDYPNLTESFSITKFQFLEGSIQEFEDNFFTIFIPISKFVLDDEIIEASIRLDEIQLPESLSSCIEKTIKFPINPVEGYIDGSIYLRNCHNPVDVTEINFLKLENQKITLVMKMNFDFEYESIGFNNELLTKEFHLEIY
jgi:hypothetical protein